MTLACVAVSPACGSGIINDNGGDGESVDSGSVTEDGAGPADAAGVVDAGGPTAELGTGLDAYAQLLPGDPIGIYAGTQGLYHLFGAVRVREIEPGDPETPTDPNNPTTTFRVFRDGAPIDFDGTTYQLGMTPSPGMSDSYEIVGRLVLLDLSSETELDGVELRVEVRVVDADGTTVTDERLVIGQTNLAG